MKKLFFIILATCFLIGNQLSAQTLTFDFTTASNWSGNTFYDFGNVPLGATSTESYFSVSGAGFIPTVGPPMVVNAPTDFQVSLTSGGPYSNQVTIPIAGGMFSSTTIYVVCTPTVLGFVGGFIEFRRDISGFLDNTTAYPYGNGVQALAAIMDITGKNGYPVPNGSTNPVGQNGTWFGSTTSGDSLSQTFTINNTGNVNLMLDSIGLGPGNYIGLSGKNPEKFKVTLQPTPPIASSGSTTFTIQFGPESVAETYEADVSIGNNDPDDNPYTFVIGARILASCPTITGLIVPPTSNTSSSAASGANVTNDGGATVTSRGLCYTLASNGWDPTTSDFTVASGSGIGQFNATMGSLTEETEYAYRGYATNAVCTEYTPASNAPTFWTLSLSPLAHPSIFTAQAFSGTQIDLTFSSPSSITYCDGYLILIRQGSYPNSTLVEDGIAYTKGQILGGGTSVAEIITNTAATTAQITGLTSGLTYYFTIIPYNWNGTNAPTYNYNKLNPSSAFATTSSATSTWNGTGSWNTPANWSNGVPGASTHAVIAQSDAGNPCLVDIDAQCNNLTIQQGAYLTVSTGRTLTVNGNIVIESNATGNGSLITNGALSITGTTTVNQFLQGAKQYQVSPPVNGETFATLQALPNNDNDFFRWRENASLWIDCNLKPSTNDLREGYGYHVLYNLATGNNVTKSYSGPLFTTNISPSITYTSTAGWPGWNLVGNPYPCGVDWDVTGWTKTGLYNIIYVYDGTDYLTWNGTTGGVAQGIIPSMQGFFVEATGAGSPAITIPLAARVHSAQGNYKSTLSELLELAVEGNGITVKTYINFNENATEGRDAQFDALKLPGKYIPEPPGMEETPQLYSIIEDDILSINVLPPSEEHVIVKLGFEPKVETTFTISASDLESFNNETKIYLEDMKENVLINLREQRSYEFEASNSDPINRFLVHFSQTEVKLGQHGFNEVDVWANNKTVYINNEDNYQGEIQVYNVMGQKVYDQRLEGSMNTIGLESQSGYYFIRVITDQTLQTTKVFIK